MRKIKLGKSDLRVSEIALGCMRMSELDTNDAKKVIETAHNEGINFYDHADIYGKGESEVRFKEALKKTSINRNEILLQSKIGIRAGFYDFSKEHIISSVEGSLKRLGTDYLDTLLLHRPDTLVEPEEVAEAFDQLHSSGKVKHFGVSNHSPLQIELLKKYVNQELIANQLQFGVMHTGMVDAGINVNTKDGNAIDHDRAVLDYSRLNDMTIQPWSPVHGEKGVFLNNPDYKKVNDKLSEVGEKYGLDNEAMSISWILRHPAQMQVILGTMTPERIKNYSKATNIRMTRKEWYDIYSAAGNSIP
ncbi:MAG: aldo/keto reductase [Alkalibacterium sp.]|uniref:Predicted oxidoreductase n=1 Tax=Alkalibacterium gilvum TaxID=1130080 RepID=A0A1H6SL66_9LACT|nr:MULTISPECIES: aldo/keto reductase [Alkalibacterium]MDN6194030.1 aldo/keto reductase [Alkalibacterium sp.]MDN6293527.1 aldo/keto reductase [Alkalibacterium sp.]MDN6295231.1 aldo/keto reductase [Alkalibacterium sp.]MDN6327282.1 aldo/keto reductase [Alkalibacterium sp.]MDN6385375.1 aldo/keto reductase [Alkalibacterium sp.]